MPLGELASFWVVQTCLYYSNCLSYLNRKISVVLQEMLNSSKRKANVLCFSKQLPEEESQNSQQADNSLLAFDQNNDQK